MNLRRRALTLAAIAALSLALLPTPALARSLGTSRIGLACPATVARSTPSSVAMARPARRSWFRPTTICRRGPGARLRPIFR